MIRNQKTEQVHRALSRYLRPRLKNNAAVSFTQLFHNVDDRNIAAHVEDIIGGAIRLTCGALAYDASPTELRQKMKQAIEADGTVSKGGEVDEDIVDRVLRLLESRLTPSELMAVRAILTKPPEKRGEINMVGEDARNARLTYDARFPNAARVKIEPTCAPAPQRQSPPANPATYFERFPNARRIGQA